jgi:glycosyltransferase involved in cell wall biosynthesis
VTLIPFVSIITPTHDREHFLPLSYECVTSQTAKSWEWLVCDSSTTPSVFMTSLSDERIRYIHDCSPMTVGDKRNLLVARSRGQYIVHFDDDDYYAPGYVAYMLKRAAASHAALVKLSAFFVLHLGTQRYAYCDLDVTEGMHFTWSAGTLRSHPITVGYNSFLTDNRLGYGFSYVYPRITWQNYKFPRVDWDEDRSFATQISSLQPVVVLPDTVGLCMHVLHDGNLSSCFPQFLVPEFLILRSFPALANYLTLLERVFPRGRQ